MKFDVHVYGKDVEEEEIRDYYLTNNPAVVIRYGMEVGRKKEFKVIKVNEEGFVVFDKRKKATYPINFTNCNIIFI